MKMHEFEVRCCCDPVKRLGWLSLPWDDAPQPFVHRVAVRTDDGTMRVEDLQVHTLSEAAAYVMDGEIRYTDQRILAVRSDDRPLSFWRALPGFREDVCYVDRVCEAVKSAQHE